MVILSDEDWICIFFLFVVWMKLPAQGANGGWVMPGLILKWFSLWEFSYLILLRVRSSVAI